MPPQIRIPETLQGSLRCPVCRANLRLVDQHIACTNPACDTRFPVVDGIPVILNERSSVFSIDDFVSHRDGFFGNQQESSLKNAVRRSIPAISKNIKGKSNYTRLTQFLLRESVAPRVLVLGGSILGQGMEPLARNTSIELLESDVSFGPRTALICDAHDIPFEDGTFDGVIAQAVLEHVADPPRCCEEIFRVLKDRGIVYAETAFMQQVHGGRYDFTRFTHLGHRRLFRKFEEIDSGAVCGPGMALAWSYEYFLLSFASSRTMRRVISAFAAFTSFYLKYLDHYLINRPGALDAASGLYFMGRKPGKDLTDKELIALYRGAGS